MSDYVIVPPVPAALPIRGSDQMFPVRRIFCVGRNYAEHAIEMGSDPTREPPFYFTKPADAVVVLDADVPYPPATSQLHHEMELVVAIGSAGSDIPVGEALKHVWGYCAGLDMTRRDLQNEAKKTGRPWDMGKGFDFSAPMGELGPAKGVDPSRGKIELRVNGEAVYDTRRWRVSAEGGADGVRYTARGDTVYAVALAYPSGGELALAVPRPGPGRPAAGCPAADRPPWSRTPSPPPARTPSCANRWPRARPC